MILTDNGWHSIKYKEKIKHSEVYDFEVNHINHRYWANGISSHNSAKSFISCYYAIKAIAEKSFDKIICIKPIMEAGEKLGALPGTIDNKIDPYYESFTQLFTQLIGKQIFNKLIEKEIIIFKPISYLRGTTINGLILMDESQNFDAKSLVLGITRMGKDAKVILTADIHQSDIKNEHIAFPWLAELVKDIEGVEYFKFNEKDIMRNSILIEITRRYEEAKIAGNVPKNKYN